ncbi:uncharacterized protein MONBRDRAFT_27026 [Monosiga brevicollis MX1]|uniref:Sulfatase N-terminal domain-containing protein n=1 Tax=Monosiga brevicollis TaxID=81824 RepID=A9V434_MONBE|nr:uncharacterized protein MONBRDRAFT_27026 [Monosiga brevicollis MX1]EDQ87636.1 predicted protein [Monosiga brevicollis MX1]|eukprot:XP_001747556.1 hypothetical protein [Monosiga brevicollis MX1]
MALLGCATIVPVSAMVDSCSAQPVTGLCIDGSWVQVYNRTNFGDCCEHCMLNAGCEAFELIPDASDQSSTCYLKRGWVNVTNPNRTDCTVGYVKGLNIPSPSLPPRPPIKVAPTGAKNILFIPVDDMRPSIGTYNFSLVHTPNMDRLATQGLRFDNAYVQYAYCAPSRNSFMSGRRPDTTKVPVQRLHLSSSNSLDRDNTSQHPRVWNFINHFRQHDVGASWFSLPEYFKQNGYLALGGGKLYHPNVPPQNDFPYSWTPEYPYYPNEPANLNHTCLEQFPSNDLTYCVADVDKDDVILEDQQIMSNCLAHLQIAKNESGNRPFFIGCGLHKPHVPWIVPKAFFDMIPPWEEVPAALDPWAPVDMPLPAWHPAADVHGLSYGFNGTCNETISKWYRRAYYAAVSYQDYNIGKTNSTGKNTRVLAEMVDIYPTLAELAGLPAPQEQGQDLNGTSLATIFDDPSQMNLKPAAFSQFGKGFPFPLTRVLGEVKISNFSVTSVFLRNSTEIMGYTIRVRDWRYTCWFGFDNETVSVRRTDILGRELYDHRGDMGLYLDWPGENINVVDYEEHAEVVAQLHQQLLDYIRL